MTSSEYMSVLIAGNVNAGKTTLFNWLARGKKVEIAENCCTLTYSKSDLAVGNGVLFDIPGFSGFTLQSEEEMTAFDIIFTKEITTIIAVIDAKNPKRGLALALQLAELGIPMTVALNMTDEAQARGIRTDGRRLGEILGLDVVETIANEKEGVPKLANSIKRSRTMLPFVTFPEDLEKTIASVSEQLQGKSVSARALALFMMCGNRYVEKHVAVTFGNQVLETCRELIDETAGKRQKPLPQIIAETYQFAAGRLAGVVVGKSGTIRSSFLEDIGRKTTQLFPGVPIALLVMTVMFLFVGKFGAQFLVDFIEGTLFKGFLIPLTVKLLAGFHSPLLTDFFCGDYGLISIGIALAFGIVFPVLFTFYLFFGFLEDSGYLPRFSVLLDKSLRAIGLNGKGIMPVIMGFSCVTMAILTTRMLDSKKEKIIATLLLVLAIPCAPLLAVMFVLLGKMKWTAGLTVFGLILVQVLIVGIVANLLIRGKRGDFITEVPALRLPSLLPIARKALIRSGMFIREAVPVFMVAAVALFAFDKVGGLNLIRNAMKPAVHYLFGLPPDSVEVIVMTLVRREAGAALLAAFFDRGVFNGVQAVVTLLIMTFLTPCTNSIIVLFKERGFKTGIAIIGFAFSYTVLFGTVVSHVLTAIGAKF